MLGFVVAGLAVVTVFVTSLLKNVEFTDRVKNLIAVVVSTLGGAVTLWVTKGGNFEGQSLIELAALTYAGSQLVYNFIVTNNSLGKKVDEALEEVRLLPGTKDRNDVEL